MALDKGKFKPPSPMTTPVEKRNASKFCEFHGEVGHTTDECMHLKRQIKEMLKAGKLSHLIKELKQSSGKDQAKARVAKQKITQTISSESVISFPPLGEEDGTEGPMIIEAEMGGHFVQRMYVDGGSSSKILGFPQPVMVKNHDDSWRMCVDFKDLNKACPKDGYPLPEIDWKAEKSLPFFKTLKKCTKKSDFQWTAEAGTAFKQMKKSKAELPMLTTPKEKEELIIYLAAAKEAISVVLMTERDGKQMPIYFISRALQGPKINYTPMEKLILALVSVSKRLKRPRTSVKGQILADFIMERPKDDPHDTPIEDEEALPDPWILFTDRSSCIDGSGAGLIITNLEGMEFTYALRFRFDATNNEEKYEALIAGLRKAEQIGIKNLQANVDSRLVANQVNGTYIAKEPGMIKYLEKVKALTSTFKEFSIKQVPRGENKKADALSKIASTSFTHLSKQVLVEELKEKSIDEKEVLAVVKEERRTWMTPIHEYLTKEILPEEKKKARGIRRKARRYVVTNGILYKRSFLGPWLRCVGPLQANYVLREIHEGSCSMYAGPRSMVAKALRLGYYWPTMHEDARKLIRELAARKQFRDNPFKDWCEKLCIRQCFASVKHPQANGLVERANKSLGEGIKAQMDERSKNWIKEISHVLWAHRTMIKSSNGDTSFSLTYGTKAAIPVEIGMPTLRTAEVDMIKNDEALEINLDLLEEKREQTAIQEAKIKSMMGKYYNARVRNISFKPGDFVYRSNEASHAEDGGKLGPKWEGPYEVTEALGKGAYKLRGRNGSILSRTWNVCNLKKSYVHEM
ncbi:reverse transcriptase domain-containing protein [Tanacetum coccineum]